MTILRRVENHVQKITKRAGMSPKGSRLTRDMVVGISKTGRSHLAGAARLYGKAFRNAEKRLSEDLAAEESDLDDLPEGYLKTIAPVAEAMPYIAVDLEDIAKKHSKAQENLCWVRNASDQPFQGVTLPLLRTKSRAVDT
jgi:hypothetical protein